MASISDGTKIGTVADGREERPDAGWRDVREGFTRCWVGINGVNPQPVGVPTNDFMSSYPRA